MPNENHVKVVVNLIDGTQQQFTFEPPPNAQLRVGAQIKELMQQNSIAFQLPDKMLIIPMARIASVEFSPPIDKQLDGVFLHAHQIT